MESSDEEYVPGEATVPLAKLEAPIVPATPVSPPPATSTASPANATATSQFSSLEHARSERRGDVGGTRASLGDLRLHGMKGRVRCICLNPSGSTLCAGSEEGNLCMWDFSTSLTSRHIEPTRILTPFVNRISGLQPIIALHCSLDGTYFVACQDGDCPALIGSGGKQLGYCAMGERGIVDVVQCKGHCAPVTDSVAHPVLSGQFLTSSQDGTARLWDQASYEHKSIFAVKHGSGQLLENVVVEAVAGLSLMGGSGSIFGTGGEDGYVQAWDSRIKYRPGAPVAAWDMYDDRSSRCGVSPSVGDEPLEKHVGGMVELEHGGVPLLAVRLGMSVKVLDMRMRRGGSGTAIRDVISGLPFTTDTTPVSAGPGNGTILTCTSRVGYKHIVGGHVVQLAYDPASSSFAPSMVWCAGKADEDVLCACADRSRADGLCYAGLSSGEIVVRDMALLLRRSETNGSHWLERWLASRPGKPSERTMGQKSDRTDAWPGEEEAVF